MKTSSSALGCVPRVHAIMVVASLSLAFAASAQTGAPPSKKPPGEQSQEAWRKAMARTPLPKKGCFKSSYPSRKWQEVPCTKAPPYPMPPRRGARPFIVGNGDDISAQAPTGFISTATGSFNSVTGVTSVSSPIGNTGLPVANAYTLQLNTNFFATTACDDSPNTNCLGWQQFVFANDGSLEAPGAFIQYWLIGYNTTCPADAGWIQFSFNGDPEIHCWKNNSMGAAGVPNQPITNLSDLSLMGTVSAGGDSVALSTGIEVVTVSGDNAVNAAAGWQIAEFNVFGYGGNSAGGGGATFNNGSTIVPRTMIIYGGSDPAVCVALGFTGETNNLSFGPIAPGASGPGPAVLFTESSTGGVPANCAIATTVGDTHLTTFGGLLYDFQASGDFVLAQTGPNFVVQSRQVSGAPRWPNASVNSAVATRMGKTKVAICLAPARLNIDGKTVNLDNGKVLALPDGVDILRKGNIYLIRGQSGDSVRAELNNGWINVSVGLGRWPVNVRGLLFNTKGYGIETRDGTVLTNPFSFVDLYHRYAESWRVTSRDSLLSVCGNKNVERGIPKKPFYASDLDPKVFNRARAVCTAAGVKVKSLLDACTLDVAVIGSKTAAKVFVDAPAPIAVVQAGLRR